MYGIYKAAFEGDVETVLAILKKNVDVNAYDEEGYTPLCRAIMGSGNKVDNHMQIVELLILSDADVNKPQKYNQLGTPLFWTTEVLRRPRLTALLLQYGAIPTSKEYSNFDRPDRLNADLQLTISSTEKSDIPDLSKCKEDIAGALIEFFETKTFQKLQLLFEKEIIKLAKRVFAGNLTRANKLFAPEVNLKLWLACVFLLNYQHQSDVRQSLYRIIDELVEQNYPPAITEKMRIVKKEDCNKKEQQFLFYHTKWIKAIINRFGTDDLILGHRFIIECTLTYRDLDPEEQIKLLKQLLTEAVLLDDAQLSYCLAKLYLGQRDLRKFFHGRTFLLEAEPIVDIEMAIKYLSMSAAQGNDEAKKDYWVIMSELFIQIKHQGKITTKKTILGSADIQAAIERLPNKEHLLHSYLPQLLSTSNAGKSQKETAYSDYFQQSFAFWQEKDVSKSLKERMNQSKSNNQLQSRPEGILGYEAIKEAIQSSIELREEVETKRGEDAVDLEAEKIKEYYENCLIIQQLK